MPADYIPVPHSITPQSHVHNPENTVRFQKIQNGYGVKVDCMGYGILEQDVLYQYIEKRKRETQILEERILEIMLESMDEGMEG